LGIPVQGAKSLLDNADKFTALVALMADGNTFGESTLEQLSEKFGSKLVELEDNLSDEEEEEDDEDDDKISDYEDDNNKPDGDDAGLSGMMSNAKI